VSGIGIITNPHSKLNKRNPETPKLLGYILGEHGRLEVTQSLEDLQKVAERFRDSHIDILAVNGGDGTISRTLTAFIKAYGDQPLPKVALLRGGTINVLASNLKIRGTSPKILFRLCEAYSSDEPLETKTLSTLEVGGHFGFLFADGVSCNFLEEFYKNKTGKFGVCWLVIKLVFSTLFKGKLFKRLLTNQRLLIKPDAAKPRSSISCTVMAATIERMPFGFKLFPDALKDKNKMQYFDIFVDPAKVLLRLPWLLLQNKTGNYRDKISDCCETLTINSVSSYTYSLDGELHQSNQESTILKVGPSVEFIIV